jgi:hypothetical protein
MRLVLHPTQSAIFRTTNRFRVVVAGRRWGKTWLARAEFARWIQQAGQGRWRFWYIAPIQRGRGLKKPGPHEATVRGREFCRQLVEDATYRANLLTRLQSGSVPPGVETMLWDRAYGKVKEVVQHDVARLPSLEIELTDAAASFAEPGVPGSVS